MDLPINMYDIRDASTLLELELENWIPMASPFNRKIGELKRFNWNLLMLFMMCRCTYINSLHGHKSCGNTAASFVSSCSMFIIIHPLCLQWFSRILNSELIIIMKRRLTQSHAYSSIHTHTQQGKSYYAISNDDVDKFSGELMWTLIILSAAAK